MRNLVSFNPCIFVDKKRRKQVLTNRDRKHVIKKGTTSNHNLENAHFF